MINVTYPKECLHAERLTLGAIAVVAAAVVFRAAGCSSSLGTTSPSTAKQTDTLNVHYAA